MTELGGNHLLGGGARWACGELREDARALGTEKRVSSDWTTDEGWREVSGVNPNREGQRERPGEGRDENLGERSNRKERLKPSGEIGAVAGRGVLLRSKRVSPNVRGTGDSGKM